MINPFKKSKKKGEQKTDLKTTASIFGSLDRLQRVGMLAWNEADRRLFIAESLALVMMANAYTWRNFLRNIYLWCYYNRMSDYWQNWMTNKELAAVRKAKEQNPALTEEEARSIRLNTRAELGRNPEEMAAADPEIKGFEFFIVLRSAQVNEGSGASGQILAVGHYEPESNSIEMAPWNEVSARIKAS